MKTTAFLILLASGFGATFSGAAEGASAAPALPTKANSRYELKSKSVVQIQPKSRSPFLPIGWVKTNTGTTPTIAQPSADEGMFKVSSILIGPPTLAVINNRPYEEGQFLRMPKTGPQLRVRVYRILDGKVLLQMDNNFLTVPLRRGTLNERKSEELLDSEKEQ